MKTTFSYIAEFVGTFFLIFFGTGAIIINDLYLNAITHTGIAITFGLVVIVMIYIFGKISGAHFNPAVSLSFYMRNELKFRELVIYFFAQISGGTAASFLLQFLLGSHKTMGGTLPTVPVWSAFLVEFILTFFLCFVILRLSVDGSKDQAVINGFVIGITIAIAALVAGPLTGASMNPARSIAPAIVSGNFQNLWIYLSAPFIGGAAAAFISVLPWEDSQKRKKKQPSNCTTQYHPH